MSAATRLALATALFAVATRAQDPSIEAWLLTAHAAIEAGGPAPDFERAALLVDAVPAAERAAVDLRVGVAAARWLARSGEPVAAGPQRVARFGDVEITVERAAVTDIVLSHFFDIPADDPDAALVIYVRVANSGPSDTVFYTTMRNGMAGVVDDLGRTYSSRDYGKVPAGGVAAAAVEPGGAVTDVLIFDAPPAEARYVDLIVPGQCVGAAATRAIRVPAELLELGLSTPDPPPGPDAPDAPPPRPSATPPPPAPPPGELVETYRRAAEQGDREGLWNLGRAYRDGFGVPQDPRKALQLLRQAAHKGHQQAMWDVVHMLRKGDGIKSDVHQEGQLLEKLLKLGDRQAHVDLARLDPSQYCAAAKTLRLRRAGARKETGLAIKTRGRLRDRVGDTWTMVLENRRTIDVDMSGIADPHVAEGIYAEVCGILNPDLVLEALVGDVPNPRYYLAPPEVDPVQGVIARRMTQYIVRGVVWNRGLQPIQSITLTVRVRVLSTLSPTKEITVYDLSVGERREYTAEITMWNPSATSAPVAEITDHSYKW